MSEKQAKRARRAKKARKDVKTELSIHPSMESTISDFQKEFLNDEIAELSPIKESEVDIVTIYIFDMDDKYEASIYVRNGLKKEIFLEKVPLHIIDKEGNIVGSQIFDLRELGKIPPMSVRPWKIYFYKKNIKVDNVTKDDYMVAFDTRITAKSTVDIELKNIPANISLNLKRNYNEFLEKLPRMKKGQFSISVYSLEKDSKGDMVITVMFRNSGNKFIKLNKLPVRVKDKEGNIVTKGIFELDNEKITIGPLSAIMHRFVFKKEAIVNNDVSIEECEVEFN